MITESLSAGTINPASFLAQGVWMPEAASTYAASVDGLWDLIFWYSAFFWVLIFGLMIIFVIRYRKRPGHKEQKTITHYLPLELIWSIPPSLFLVVFFFWGMKTYIHMYTPPEDAYQISVSAYKWNWEFTYPNGVTEPELHIPVNTPVKLTMSSQDVIHSLFIPAFRAKTDVVPGRFQQMWFEANQTGEFHLFCTEYCGTGHSAMITKCVVHTAEGFEEWMAEASNIWEKDGKLLPVAEVGEALYNKRGCAQCHSVDGEDLTGPTWQGIWGATHVMSDGSEVTVDENYILNSIWDPGSQVVQGYDNVMPTYKGKLDEREIGALVEFIKTLE